MRIWTLSPKYLDAKGLVALWRESLLARAVLEGQTKGYTNHPQLLRFKSSENPIGAINEYLKYIFEEANARGYKFSKNKLTKESFNNKIPVTSGQVDYEFKHLLNKLQMREIKRFEQFKDLKNLDIVNIFELVDGEIEAWEKIL